MAENQKEKTLADYVAIAISPALIMALVGSLVFFLVEVLYVGNYQARLQWILFFFVFGAVLIARMSMTNEVAGRAGIYGLVLGFLVWLALVSYVEYPRGSSVAAVGWAINLGLLAVTWWSAHRLTWDCTLIDDNVDASGSGLLDAAGLEAGTAADAAPAGEPAEEPKQRPKRGLVGWWQRYRRYRAERARPPRAPGVGLGCCSLAALPLFGLGQSLIPPADVGRRRYVFWLMIVYVGSGLGLLLTTSFLGLRRYLRQRGLQMPAAMTSVWLTAGALLIAALLFVGALLPRPNAEYPWLEMAGLVKAKDRKASRFAQRGDSPGKGKGRAADDGTGKKGQDDGGAGREKDGRGKGKSEAKDGQGKGKGGEGDGDRKGDPQKGAGNQPQEADEQGDGVPDAPPPRFLPELSQQVATILKWVVAVVAALLLLFVLLRSGLRWLANFTTWARRLLAALAAIWQGLLAWLQGGGSSGEAAAAEEAEQPPPRPFAEFRDPFQSGEAERQAPGELVRYTFEALQAWAYERGLPRQPGETPLEFAGRVGGDYPALEEGALRLANDYAGLAYARREPPPACREPLRRFWKLLYDVLEWPLSAGG